MVTGRHEPMCRRPTKICSAVSSTRPTELEGRGETADGQSGSAPPPPPPELEGRGEAAGGRSEWRTTQIRSAAGAVRGQGGKQPRNRRSALPATKREVCKAVELPLTHSELFAAVGIDPLHDVLLYGSPWTRKTMLVRAVALAANAVFFQLSGADLLARGGSEELRTMRYLFCLTRKKPPSGELLTQARGQAEIPKLAKSRSSKKRSFVSLLRKELEAARQHPWLCELLDDDLPWPVAVTGNR